MSGSCPLDKGRTSCPQRPSSLVPPTSSRVPKELNTQGLDSVPSFPQPQYLKDTGAPGAAAADRSGGERTSYNTGSGLNSAQPPAWLLYPEEGARATRAQSRDPRHLGLKDRTKASCRRLCPHLGVTEADPKGPCGYLSTWPHMHGHGGLNPVRQVKMRPQ